MQSCNRAPLHDRAQGSYNITICTKATVHYDGSVLWEPPAIFEVGKGGYSGKAPFRYRFQSLCTIDIQWFPFDIQKCDLKVGHFSHRHHFPACLQFGSWTYAEKLVSLYHLGLEEGEEIRDLEFNERTQVWENVTSVEYGIGQHQFFPGDSGECGAFADVADYFPSVEWDILEIPAKRRRKSYSATFVSDRVFIDITVCNFGRYCHKLPLLIL